jgi:alpha-glucosidase
MRPCLDLSDMQRGPGQDLLDAIRRLIAVRRGSEALRRGDYRPLSVASEQLAFLRQAPGESVVVAVSAAASGAMTLTITGCNRAALTDLLNPPTRFDVAGGKARLDVPGPCLSDGGPGRWFVGDPALR